MSAKPNQTTLDDFAGSGYVRLKLLLESGYVPFSSSTLWRKVKEGSFPKPVKLSDQITAWKVDELRRWAANPCEYRFKDVRRTK